MADTARDLAALLALLADNTSGNISPQDLRDCLVSCLGEYGVLYKTSATNQSVSATPSKLTAFSTAGVSGGNVTVSAGSNRITVGNSGKYRVTIACQFTNASVADRFSIVLYKNGSTTGFASQTQAPAANEPANVVIDTIIDLTAADYLEVYGVAAGGSRTVDVGNPCMTVQRVE